MRAVEWRMVPPAPPAPILDRPEQADQGEIGCNADAPGGTKRRRSSQPQHRHAAPARNLVAALESTLGSRTCSDPPPWCAPRDPHDSCRTPPPGPTLILRVVGDLSLVPAACMLWGPVPLAWTDQGGHVTSAQAPACPHVLAGRASAPPRTC